MGKGAGYRALDTGFWILDDGCWILDTGSWFELHPGDYQYECDGVNANSIIMEPIVVDVMNEVEISG